MKRTLIASLLGLTACTAAFGQGVIQFSNYISTQYNQVVYFGGAPVADPGVEVQLFWELGNQTSESLSQFYSTANAGVTTFINPGFTYKGGGYYAGPNQLLTGWTSSQTVTFGVEGWATTGVHGGTTYATSGLEGQSVLWTEVAGANANANGIQPSSNPAKGFNNGPPEMVIGGAIPEPSPFALSSIAAGGLMLFRRKKSRATYN